MKRDCQGLNRVWSFSRKAIRRAGAKDVAAAMVAILLPVAARAYEANLNVDWKFAKGGGELYGLDAALKANEQKAKVSFRSDGKKIQNKRLRPFCTNPQKPYFAWLQIKAGGKTVDAISGLTVLFEDNGRDKNLTNFEMTTRDGFLVGELGPLLGYIPGLTVKCDENRRVLSIEVTK